MEVFGHLKFALEDAEAMFADMLRANGAALGFAEIPTGPARSAP
jgi:hypothetical protein